MKEPREVNQLQSLPKEFIYQLMKHGYTYAEDFITIPMLDWKIKGIFYKRSGSLANNSGVYIMGWGLSHSLAKEVEGEEGMTEYISYYKYSFSEPGYIETDHESISYGQRLMETFFDQKL